LVLGGSWGCGYDCVIVQLLAHTELEEGMALFLDSAQLEDARRASSLGFILGATTNPGLLARAGHTDALQALKALCPLFPGTVFYQLLAHTPKEMEAEAEAFLNLAENIGLKVPCTVDGLAFTAQVSARTTVAVTGVFTPAQAYLSAQAGAEYVIPYVNRVTRFTGDGPGLVGQIAAILEPTDCEILAAGIKSPAEAVDTLLAGAQHVSLPLDVILAMAESPLTEKAIVDFEAAWAARGKAAG
jgi:transaldolase